MRCTGSALDARSGLVEEARALRFGKKLGGNKDAALENEVDGVGKHLRIEYLRHEPCGTELQHAHDVLLICQAGKNENLEKRLNADDFFHELRAGDARHREVKNEQIRVVAFSAHEIERFLRSAGGVHFC